MQDQLVEEGEDPTALRLVGYTLDQLRDRVQMTHRQTVYELPKGAGYLHDKYLAETPTAGRLGIKDGKVDVVDPPPPVPDMGTLDEQIAGRSVRYGVKEGT